MQQREHHTIDATNRAIGRLATEAVSWLMGKNKATYLPHVDAGAIVRIKNASKVRITGKKLDQKSLIHHSFHPGGIKRVPLKRVMQEKPEKAVLRAISKMLPRNKHRKNRLARLIIEA